MSLSIEMHVGFEYPLRIQEALFENGRELGLSMTSSPPLLSLNELVSHTAIFQETCEVFGLFSALNFSSL